MRSYAATPKVLTEIAPYIVMAPNGAGGTERTLQDPPKSRANATCNKPCSLQHPMYCAEFTTQKNKNQKYQKTSRDSFNMSQHVSACLS